MIQKNTIGLTNVVLSMCLGMFACLAQAQNIRIDKSDEIEAAKQLGLGQKKISEITQQHLDGVRGYRIKPFQIGPKLSGIFPDAQMDQLRTTACEAQVFGIAQLIGSQSFVGEAGKGVYTKLSFRLTYDLKNSGMKSNTPVDIVVSGGEAEYNGEKIRVENSTADYVIHNRYVVLVTPRMPANGGVYFGDPPFMEIDNNTIYPAPGWAPFSSGTTLKSAQRKVRDVLSKQPCNR